MLLFLGYFWTFDREALNLSTGNITLRSDQNTRENTRIASDLADLPIFLTERSALDYFEHIILFSNSGYFLANIFFSIRLIRGSTYMRVYTVYYGAISIHLYSDRFTFLLTTVCIFFLPTLEICCNPMRCSSDTFFHRSFHLSMNWILLCVLLLTVATGAYAIETGDEGEKGNTTSDARHGKSKYMRVSFCITNVLLRKNSKIRSISEL